MIVTTRPTLHFVHGEKYPLCTDSAVVDVVFQRASRLGPRDPEQISGKKTVGWIVHQLDEAPDSVCDPLHQAIRRLRLIPQPIPDETNCMTRAEDMVPFLRSAAVSVNTLIYYSSTHTAVYAGAANQLRIPLINAAYVARLIKIRQIQMIKVDPLCVWRALLEVVLDLLPDTENT